MCCGTSPSPAMRGARSCAARRRAPPPRRCAARLGSRLLLLLLLLLVVILAWHSTVTPEARLPTHCPPAHPPARVPSSPARRCGSACWAGGRRSRSFWRARWATTWCWSGATTGRPWSDISRSSAPGSAPDSRRQSQPLARPALQRRSAPDQGWRYCEPLAGWVATARSGACVPSPAAPAGVGVIVSALETVAYFAKQ